VFRVADSPAQVMSQALGDPRQPVNVIEKIFEDEAAR
jgi:hypothetical protein